MQLANSGKRIGAYIIDALIITVIGEIIISLFRSPEYLAAVAALDTQLNSGAITYTEYTQQLSLIVDPNQWLINLGTLLVAALYFVVLPLFWKDQTVGRLACKIKVVKETGEKADAKDLVIREAIGQELIVYAVSVVTALVAGIEILGTVVGLASFVILIVGFFRMTGQRKITLYDEWSKTRMVLKNSLNKVTEDELVDQKDIIDV